MKIGLTFNARAAESSPRESGILTPKDVSAISLADDVEEEFDSLATIEALASAVRALGHEVELLGEGEPLIRRLLSGPRPDLALNFAEGRGASRSREARVPALLETLNIPFTGSDPLTLAVTLDKDCAKRLARDAGVPTPAWALYDGDDAEFSRRLEAIELPCFAKPAYEGSSKGILDKSVLSTRDESLRAVRALRAAYRQPILLEEYIAGDELTVGVVGNDPPEVIGVMRVTPRVPTVDFVYSLEVKRDFERRVRYECPAEIGPQATDAVRRATLDLWRAFGCRDVARFDFRLRDGVPYFLECNPLPGLSPTSGDLVILSRLAGVKHLELIRRILTAACKRLGLDG